MLGLFQHHGVVPLDLALTRCFVAATTGGATHTSQSALQAILVLDKAVSCAASVSVNHGQVPSEKLQQVPITIQVQVPRG